MIELLHLLGLEIATLPDGEKKNYMMDLLLNITQKAAEVYESLREMEDDLR